MNLKKISKPNPFIPKVNRSLGHAGLAGGAVIAVWSQQRAELPAVSAPTVLGPKWHLRASRILRTRYTGNFNTESRSVPRAVQLCAEACFPRSELGASFNDCFTELIQCCTDGESTECAKLTLHLLKDQHSFRHSLQVLKLNEKLKTTREKRVVGLKFFSFPLKILHSSPRGNNSSIVTSALHLYGIVFQSSPINANFFI